MQSDRNAIVRWHGQVQKSSQKHLTKESNVFHNYSTLMTMVYLNTNLEKPARYRGLTLVSPGNINVKKNRIK